MTFIRILYTSSCIKFIKNALSSISVVGLSTRVNYMIVIFTIIRIIEIQCKIELRLHQTNRVKKFHFRNVPRCGFNLTMVANSSTQFSQQNFNS